MPTPRSLSAVIDAMIDVAQRIEGASWPPHPTTGRYPKVGKALETIETPDEWVDISSRTDDNSSVDWMRIAAKAPGRRDERFWIDILVNSAVPGASRIVALQRLASLVAVVERLFLEEDGTFHPVLEGEPAAVDLGGVRQVVARADRTDEGWTSRAVISVAVQVRI